MRFGNRRQRNLIVEILDYIELMLVVNNYAAAIVMKCKMEHRNDDGDWDPFLSPRYLPMTELQDYVGFLYKISKDQSTASKFVRAKKFSRARVEFDKGLLTHLNVVCRSRLTS